MFIGLIPVTTEEALLKIATMEMIHAQLMVVLMERAHTQIPVSALQIMTVMIIEYAQQTDV